MTSSDGDMATAIPRRGRLESIRITTSDGLLVCAACDVADRALPRMRGLLGRTSLEEGSGMLIRPAPSVHMFFMRFAIDVVFLDRSWTIAGVAHTLRPWRVAGARKAVMALELPAGTATRLGLQRGDQLLSEPV
jgi:uncharacterized protein